LSLRVRTRYAGNWDKEDGPTDGSFAVGMALAGHPPHRSRRAELPHRAPALGFDVLWACYSLVTYPVERMLQVYLAMSPEPGLLSRIPLSQTPSLQALRRTGLSPLFVRALLRYYGFVRLPVVVHHGCTFLLTARTLATGQGQQRDLPGSAQEVSVRAWGLRPRGACAHLAMAMRTVLPSGQSQGVGTPYKALSRLDTQPAPAPVNACHNPSQGNSHDSGASVVRYTFTARDFHPQLLAGLSRRFGFQPFTLRGPLSWGFAPGWYGIGPSALTRANWRYRITQR